MKKHSLFKILSCIFLGYFLLTWFVKASYYSGGLQDVGLYPASITGIFPILLQALSYFPLIFIFVLLVGAFYSLLEKTGAYRNLLDKIVSATKNSKIIVLMLVMVAITIISSIAGLDLGMFVIFPFLITLFIMMGFDKIVAIIAVFGATIVGSFASTFAYTMYGVNNSILSLKYTDGLLIKLILLVGGLALLILFVYFLNNYKEKKQAEIAKKEKKLSSKKSKEVKVMVCNDNNNEDDFVPEFKIKNKKGWPIILVLSLVLLIYVLGTIGWEAVFKVTWFTDLYENITNFTLFKQPIFENVFSGFTAFGTWIDPKRYLQYSVVLLFAMIVISLIYGIKFDNIIKSSFEGAKKYLGTAILIVMSYAILVLVSTYPIFLTTTDWFINLTTGAKCTVTGNVLNTAVTSLFGSALFVDMYYYPQYVLQYYASLGCSNTVVLNILFVAFYNIAMLVAPTSVLLIASLNTFKAKYSDWIKNIWILFVALFLLALIVLSIAAIILK